jgi:glycosyltransferase involved in cell wall biosynthesis
MIARWMEQHRFTHLHVHFATAAASVGLVLRSFYPCTLSFTVHGPDEFYDAKGQWLSEKAAAVDFLVCIGRFARSQMMQLSPGNLWHKFDVCPLGVDPSVFVPVAHDADATQPFRILCVGRLTPAKGQRVLIDACRQLRNNGRDFRLVIVGTGPDEAELKALVNQYGLDDLVQFTGALNQEQVIAHYAKADAFALPSFSEGIPVVLMEAMASGVPCVTTRITGIPELIRDGVDGLLVTPSDADELADALTALMDDPELRQDIARQGREKVLAEFDLNRNVERLAAVFRSRLGSLSC